MIVSIMAPDKEAVKIPTDNQIRAAIENVKKTMFLTFLTISITSFHLGAFTVTVALLIAGVKGFLVLSYFMHLKYESLLLRILVGMVFVLFIVIVLITFIDYAYR